METKICFADAVTKAWAVEKPNLVVMVVGTILVSLVSALSCGICFAAMVAGLMSIGLRQLDGDTRIPEVGDVFGCFKYLLPGLVLVILGVLGVLLCGVGIFVTLPLAALSIARVVDTGNTASCGIAALGEVYAQVKARRCWSIILWTYAAFIVCGLGSVFCCIGDLVTYPLGVVTIAALYRQLFPKAEAPVAGAVA